VTMAEAPAALWRGTLPRVAQLAPLSAVSFFAYEGVKALLEAHRRGGAAQVPAALGGGGGGGVPSAFRAGGVACDGAGDLPLRDGRGAAAAANAQLR